MMWLKKFGAAGAALALAGALMLPAAAQETITIQTQDAPVGGLAWSAQTGLLVGERAGGAVYVVGADGALTPVVQDEAITGVVAMTADSATGRLYVLSRSGGAGGEGGFALPEGFDPSQLPEGIAELLPEGFDPSQLQPGQLPEGLDLSQLPEGFPDPSQFLGQMGDASASLLVYDLASGGQLQAVDLTGAAGGAASLTTSVAVDSAGNAYITDGLASAVYRVDAAGSIAVLTDAQFTADTLGLVGVVVLPGDVLLLAKADGTLYTIPLADPSNVQPVALDTPPAGISAIALLADGRIVTLDAASARVTAWASSDNWASAQAAGSASVPQGASELTSDGTSVWAMQGLMGMMGAVLGSDAPEAPALTITPVDL
jgi:hypothetical protein